MPGEAARGWFSLAARSARGGTMGRAAGCPASGRAGGLGAEGIGVPGAMCGAGLPADMGALGARAATPGLVRIGADGEGDGAIGSLVPGGIGWRGPESTWPGRAGGTGLATGGVGRPGANTEGAGAMRGATGAWACAPGGELPASGGRMGSDGRPAGRSGAVVPAAGSRVFSSMAAWPGWPASPPGETSRAGARDGSTEAAGRPEGVAARASGSANSSGDSPVSSRRSLMATSSSIELEWVFFSVTPNAGSRSRISFALTSSSRASSLIRILFIDTKLSRGDAPHSLCEPPSSDSSCETRPESIMVSDSPAISMSCGSPASAAAFPRSSTMASASGSGAPSEINS